MIEIAKLSAFYPPGIGLNYIIENWLIKSAANQIQIRLAHDECIERILLHKTLIAYHISLLLTYSLRCYMQNKRNWKKSPVFLLVPKYNKVTPNHILPLVNDTTKPNKANQNEEIKTMIAFILTK